MFDPVVAADGFTYERQAMERWLFTCNKRISPKTGERLMHTGLIPNTNLKIQIADFKEKIPEMQRREIELQRKRLEETDFRIALQAREEDIAEHVEVTKVKQELHEQESRELHGQIENLKTAKEKLETELKQAEETAEALQEDKKDLEKKLQQARTKNNKALTERYEKQLNELQEQLDKANEEKGKLAADHKRLEEFKEQVGQLTEDRDRLKEEVQGLRSNNEVLKERIAGKEKEIEAKDKALTEADETIAAIRGDQEALGKKLEQALSKNNAQLVTMYQEKLGELKRQLEETEHNRQNLDEERKKLDMEKAGLAERNQKLLVEINAKVELLRADVEEGIHELKDQLAETFSAIDEANRLRQEQLMQGLEKKIEEYSKKADPGSEVLLADLIAEKKLELERNAHRQALVEQPDFTQIKDFYLSIQREFNAQLKSDEIQSTGDFATQNTTKKEKTAKVISTCARLVPLVSTAVTAVCGLTKLYAENRKQKRAISLIADLSPNTASREAMVEEIALGLCERYEDQLKALSAETEEERRTAINKLVNNAVQRMHAYLQAQRTLEPEPVIALINAVRQNKISGDRKIRLFGKTTHPVTIVAASAEAQPLNPATWTVHGFFSQSGIRTQTPRRRRFANEAPTPDVANKKGTNYTDVQHYGYAQDTEAAAVVSRMVELKI
jgi:chromosome segregation ATPase